MIIAKYYEITCYPIGAPIGDRIVADLGEAISSCYDLRRLKLNLSIYNSASILAATVDKGIARLTDIYLDSVCDELKRLTDSNQHGESLLFLDSLTGGKFADHIKAINRKHYNQGFLDETLSCQRNIISKLVEDRTREIFHRYDYEALIGCL